MHISVEATLVLCFTCVMVLSINMGSNEQREPCVASRDAWWSRM
ncbi:hypothetical protein BDA96_05G096900 [Sorghum bicolor]|uniref:Uncharacterized protein n=1 Tax=Sorghum bicolor TaxID=4558 RepID=A0A921UFU7_SORBI|nr:hypothetical protein BDA96_05G096900 [Sorghum bicolor]